MIRTYQILRKDNGILIGIALDDAVLDIVTNEGQIRKCLQALREPHVGLVSVVIGSFGIYPVTLNVHHDDTVSIFVDGPDFNESRNQSAGIWLGKHELERLLVEAIKGTSFVD